MKFTGWLKRPVIDYLTGRMTIMFEVNEDFRQAYEELKDCKKLSIEIKRYRRKRSLDANAYYRVLLEKLARRTGQSNTYLHNQMLRTYGQHEILEGEIVGVKVPDTDSAIKNVDEAMNFHLKPTSEILVDKEGAVYRMYELLRGSRTYNSEEMAQLIDGLISECKNAGLTDAEIATPDEKRLLRERYGVEL